MTKKSKLEEDILKVAELKEQGKGFDLMDGKLFLTWDNLSWHLYRYNSKGNRSLVGYYGHLNHLARTLITLGIRENEVYNLEEFGKNLFTLQSKTIAKLESELTEGINQINTVLLELENIKKEWDEN